MSRNVLIVEDEPLIAFDLREMLEDTGAYQVVGMAATVRDALAMLQDRAIDCAVLDVNLRGEPSDPVARALGDMGVPFLSVSGYDLHQAPKAFEGATMLKKPVSAAILLEELGRLGRTPP